MAFIEPMHRNKPNITYLTFGITCPIGQVGMQVHLSPTMPYLSLLDLREKSILDANNAYEYEICTCPIGQFR